MQKVLKFTNFSNEDFVGSWNGDPWKIKAGETIMLQAYLAVHFSKHLIDRELNKKDENTSNQIERAKMLKRCLGDVVKEVESEEKAETETLNQEPISDEVEVSKDLSRKELNEIAKDEGVVNPEDFGNKQEVIDAINDGRGEDPKTENESKKDEEKNKDDKEKVDEEDEFEGNNKDEEK